MGKLDELLVGRGELATEKGSELVARGRDELIIGGENELVTGDEFGIELTELIIFEVKEEVCDGLGVRGEIWSVVLAPVHNELVSLVPISLEGSGMLTLVTLGYVIFGAMVGSGMLVVACIGMTGLFIPLTRFKTWFM